MSRINIYFSKDFEDVEQYLNTKNNKSLYIAELIRKDMNKESDINGNDIDFIKENINNILNILVNSDGISFKKEEVTSTQHDSDGITVEDSMELNELDMNLLDDFD